MPRKLLCFCLWLRDLRFFSWNTKTVKLWCIVYRYFLGILYPTDVRNRGFTMALYPIFARALAVFWLILSWRFILAPCVLWHTFNWRLSDSGTPCPVSTLIAAWRGILAHAVRRGVGSTSDTKGSIELWARQQQYVLLYKHLCTAPTRFASFNPLLRPTCEVDLPPLHLLPLKSLLWRCGFQFSYQMIL